MASAWQKYTEKKHPSSRYVSSVMAGHSTNINAKSAQLSCFSNFGSLLRHIGVGSRHRPHLCHGEGRRHVHGDELRHQWRVSRCQGASALHLAHSPSTDRARKVLQRRRRCCCRRRSYLLVGPALCVNWPYASSPPSAWGPPNDASPTRTVLTLSGKTVFVQES